MKDSKHNDSLYIYYKGLNKGERTSLIKMIKEKLELSYPTIWNWCVGNSYPSPKHYNKIMDCINNHSDNKPNCVYKSWISIINDYYKGLDKKEKSRFLSIVTDRVGVTHKTVSNWCNGNYPPKEEYIGVINESIKYHSETLCKVNRSNKIKNNVSLFVVFNYDDGKQGSYLLSDIKTMPNIGDEIKVNGKFWKVNRRLIDFTQNEFVSIQVEQIP